MKINAMINEIFKYNNNKEFYEELLKHVKDSLIYTTHLDLEQINEQLNITTKPDIVKECNFKAEISTGRFLNVDCTNINKSDSIKFGFYLKDDNTFMFRSVLFHLQQQELESHTKILTFSNNELFFRVLKNWDDFELHAKILNNKILPTIYKIEEKQNFFYEKAKMLNHLDSETLINMLLPTQDSIKATEDSIQMLAIAKDIFIDSGEYKRMIFDFSRISFDKNNKNIPQKKLNF